MHAGMDEPELLMELLATIAEQKARGPRGDAWAIVAATAHLGIKGLEEANETPRR
jgi:hypothetical protein